MARTLLWTLVCCLVVPAGAAARTLDLVTYTAPRGWNVEEKDTHVSLSRLTETTYCMVTIYPSTLASGSLGASFAAEWEAVALKTIAEVDAPAPTTRRVGNTSAAVGSAESTTGGQPTFATLVVLDAGQSVVSLLVLAPSAAAMKACDAEVQPLLSGLSVKRVGAPSSPRSATPETPAPAPVAARPTRIAELAGDWGLTDGINERYVDRYTGTYAGTYSLHFTEKWTITPQGGITFDFFGLQNGRRLSEKSTGAVTLTDGILVIKLSNVQRYVLRGWYDGPGATVMVLNGPWYEQIPADILRDPEQGSNLDKKWLRKK